MDNLEMTTVRREDLKVPRGTLTLRLLRPLVGGIRTTQPLRSRMRKGVYTSILQSFQLYESDPFFLLSDEINQQCKNYSAFKFVLTLVFLVINKKGRLLVSIG